MKKVFNVLRIFAAAVIFSSPVYAIDTENGLFGQFQFGGSLYENPSSNAYADAQYDNISSDGYTAVKKEDSTNKMISCLFNLSYMKDSIGVSFLTGIMGDIKNHKIKYYKTDNPLPDASNPTSQATCTVSSYILPQCALFVFSSSIMNKYSFSFGAGPGVFVYYNSFSIAVKDGQKKKNYTFSGDKKEYNPYPGAFSFVQFSGAITSRMTVDVGVNTCAVYYHSNIKLIPSLFVGITERSTLF